jgi:hypothetical protein
MSVVEFPLTTNVPPGARVPINVQVPVPVPVPLQGPPMQVQVAPAAKVPVKVNEPPVAVPVTLNVPPEPNVALGLYRKPPVLAPVVKLTVPELAPSLMPNADKPLTLVRAELFKLRVVLELFDENVPSRFRNVAVFPSVMVFAIAVSGTNTRMVARARTCTLMKYASAKLMAT